MYQFVKVTTHVTVVASISDEVIDGYTISVEVAVEGVYHRKER